MSGKVSFKTLLKTGSSNPKVNLQTTGGGSTRFNPNLYNCGKVCLSLLGTWQGAEGESWHAKTSTLLQVFMSIQALILVPDPFFNEPGFQNMLGTPQGTNASKHYNSSVREATLRHAMGDALERPSAVFKPIVEKHFKLKGAAVLEQLRRWEADAPAARPGGGSLPGGGSGCAGTRGSTTSAAERVRGLLLGAGAKKAGGGTSKRPIVL